MEDETGTRTLIFFLLNFEILVSNIIFTLLLIPIQGTRCQACWDSLSHTKKIAKYNLLLCGKLTVQWPEANSLVILIRLMLRVQAWWVQSGRFNPDSQMWDAVFEDVYFESCAYNHICQQNANSELFLMWANWMLYFYFICFNGYSSRSQIWQALSGIFSSTLFFKLHCYTSRWQVTVFDLLVIDFESFTQSIR